MQAAFLDEANPAAISHAVRDVLERRGALVSEHVSHRIRFDALGTGSSWSWNRSGYVGIYQRYGEKECEVRLDLHARWPQRVLWTVAAVNVAVWVFTFLLNPPGTTWFVLAFVCGMALVVAGLVSLNTWRSVRDQERDLMIEFEREFASHRVSSTILTQEERMLAQAEADLEGEVERLRVEAARKNAPKPVKARNEKKSTRETPAKAAPSASKFKFSFGKKKEDQADDASVGKPTPPPANEDPEAKRARLLALKAEIERKRGEQQ